MGNRKTGTQLIGFEGVTSGWVSGSTLSFTGVPSGTVMVAFGSSESPALSATLNGNAMALNGNITNSGANRRLNTYTYQSFSGGDIDFVITGGTTFMFAALAVTDDADSVVKAASGSVSVPVSAHSSAALSVGFSFGNTNLNITSTHDEELYSLSDFAGAGVEMGMAFRLNPPDPSPFTVSSPWVSTQLVLN